MAQMPQGKFLIEHIPFESTSAAWLNGVVQKSILNQDGFDWTPVKIERITNRVLERHYDVKRAEVSRFSGADLEERYGFTAELDSFRLDLILADGLQAGMVNCNALGFAEYGVYVCDNLDVALRYSTLKSHDVHNSYVVVYKYFLARNTKCVPKSAVSFERIDPTIATNHSVLNTFLKPPEPFTRRLMPRKNHEGIKIGYDSHNSIIPPKANDPITTQFERSQIYLYELNSQDIPMPRPRHCLPIAVITYTRDAAKPAATATTDAATDTVPDRFAGNPALRAIVERINAKQQSPIPQPGLLPSPPYPAQHQNGDSERFKDNPRLKELIDRINSRTPWLGPHGGHVPPGACPPPPRVPGPGHVPGRLPYTEPFSAHGAGIPEWKRPPDEAGDARYWDSRHDLDGPLGGFDRRGGPGNQPRGAPRGRGFPRPLPGQF